MLPHVLHACTGFLTSMSSATDCTEMETSEATAMDQQKSSLPCMQHLGMERHASTFECATFHALPLPIIVLSHTILELLLRDLSHVYACSMLWIN